MGCRVFMSHSSADKPFVRQLARDLDLHGVRCWLDEAEIRVGESLIQKIRDAIDDVAYVAVVLSPSSVASPWVRNEVDVAMNQEIAGHRVKVLPILYRPCELPGFLLGKKHADFTDENRYQEALRVLVETMGVVYSNDALRPGDPLANLGLAVDRAIEAGVPLLCHPFHRPFQYLGLTVDEAVRQTGGTLTEQRNIVAESDQARLFLEVEGNFVQYIEVALKWTAPHRMDSPFDSVPLLGALSISPSELEPVRASVHCHTYYDHRRRLKVMVSCLGDTEPICVCFSMKYYGQ